MMYLVKKACAYTAMSLAALLVGCAAPKPLYQWEGYQAQVYNYLRAQGSTGPEAQIAALEQGFQKIRAQGGTPPPGYHAHLGLLYLQVGKDDQAVQELRTEKALFPESAGYMDFLLAKAQKK
ncbi:DUF4810 domain-containing protein [Aquabacterium soli]|jgi:hypothetical protein|uniref:DUF4810 domain-containing protein n=1 Tax=Aquabacterium soli TaxID=2493092 RepID=A0A3R8TB86_9BURK|nr:DUF4810 domain-containing protein [Aquabacterium soli]RRS03767.1 DUF4810 domain-containing protein [Aquabacterium soli]